MLKSEAYQALKLPETATKEEARKAFKSMAKIYHPDVNKSPEAEAMFKQANEAYQAIESDTFDDNRGSFGGSPFSGGWGGIDLGDILGGMGDFFGAPQRRRRKSPRNNSLFRDITMEQTITFKESVLGCKKDVIYTCSVECEKCHGDGDKPLDNGCKKCRGTGRSTSQQGNVIFSGTCTECRGKIEFEECKECATNGYVISTRTVSVSIKPGITDGAILRLAGMGNYTSAGHTSVLLTIKVVPADGLSLQGQDVMGAVNISLLEALTGCNKEVPTIEGPTTISIPAASKNREEVFIPKLGVAQTGNQRVIINITYPENLTKLIDILKEEV